METFSELFFEPFIIKKTAQSLYIPLLLLIIFIAFFVLPEQWSH